ncbi:trypsin-like peptidase domain-containing protein, partial [Streptomyces virginiae]|uniref:trypsin-like peptidase domain-containing protein n=1 Tax=Streptomyces virginiae TaxID=1961 RepID=UPI00188C180E
GRASRRGAAGRWGAHKPESFWTPERMASARPLPPVPPQPGVAPEYPAADPVRIPPVPPVDAPEPLDPPEPPLEPVEAPEPPEPAPVAAPSPSDTPTVGAPEPAATPSVLPAPVPEPVPTPSILPAPAPVRPALPRIPAAGPGVGQDFGGLPVVGRMFLVKGGGSYFCTASVVASPGRNLVISAAHCLLGSDTQQVAFVPQYTRAKPRPFGMFPVVRTAAGRSKIWIDQRYRTQGVNRAAALDVAFAQVGPGAKGLRVQDVVGGNRLVTGAGYAHARATLIGHPSTAARPRLCVNRTTKYTSTDARIPGSFLRIACTGYPGGTSGGPFLLRLDGRTGTGDVVGVIGGWKTGGDKSDVSYSSYFGTDIRKLYEKAVAGAKAS